MKKILYIFTFVLALNSVSFAQDDPGEKLRDKMIEYIQTKLGLSKAEAEKFQPVFLDYLKEMRTTKQQFKGDNDKLRLQQKIIDLRIRYREQFKTIIGEKRSNEVYKYERDFIEHAKIELNDRLEHRKEGRPNKKSGFLQ